MCIGDAVICVADSVICLAARLLPRCRRQPVRTLYDFALPGLVDFFGWQNSWYLTLVLGFSIQKGLSRHYFNLHGPSLALWPAQAPRRTCDLFFLQNTYSGT